MEVAEGSQPQAIELAKAIAQALARLVERGPRYFIVHIFPCAGAKRVPGQIAGFCVALEMAAGRIGGRARNSKSSERGGIYQRCSAEDLNVDGMSGRGGVKLGASG